MSAMRRAEQFDEMAGHCIGATGSSFLYARTLATRPLPALCDCGGSGKDCADLLKLESTSVEYQEVARDCGDEYGIQLRYLVRDEQGNDEGGSASVFHFHLGLAAGPHSRSLWMQRGMNLKARCEHQTREISVRRHIPE